MSGEYLTGPAQALGRMKLRDEPDNPHVTIGGITMSVSEQLRRLAREYRNHRWQMTEKLGKELPSVSLPPEGVELDAAFMAKVQNRPALWQLAQKIARVERQVRAVQMHAGPEPQELVTHFERGLARDHGPRSE